LVATLLVHTHPSCALPPHFCITIVPSTVHRISAFVFAFTVGGGVTRLRIIKKRWSTAAAAFPTLKEEKLSMATVECLVNVKSYVYETDMTKEHGGQTPDERIGNLTNLFTLSSVTSRDRMMVPILEVTERILLPWCRISYPVSSPDHYL
jgi:hypothetical protein